MKFRFSAHFITVAFHHQNKFLEFNTTYFTSLSNALADLAIDFYYTKKLMIIFNKVNVFVRQFDWNMNSKERCRDGALRSKM
jgi:hypothetical protein